MITGWGVHHIDIAHWGMNTELTGPIEIEASAEFPKSGLWNVHGDYEVHAKYANGVSMYMSSKNPNGIKFEGSNGWIFVTRGNVGVTASDPGPAARTPRQHGQGGDAGGASRDGSLLRAAARSAAPRP